MDTEYFKELAFFVFAVIIRWLFPFTWFYDDETRYQNNFFYRTGRIIIPLIILGLIKVESPDNVDYLDWRTLPEQVGDWVGFLFWAAVAYGVVLLFLLPQSSQSVGTLRPSE